LTETLRPPHVHAGEEWSSAKRWIPWICAYSGASVNEVTQLRGKDLSQHTFGDEEVWVITITPEAGTVKNKEARHTAWRNLLARLPDTLDLDESAREHGALKRRRVVRDGRTLLRLALAYATGGMSLRSAAASVAACDIAQLSDVALL